MLTTQCISGLSDSLATMTWSESDRNSGFQAVWTSSVQPLWCHINEAWLLGFYEGHWVDSWFGLDTVPLSLITASESHLLFDLSVQFSSFCMFSSLLLSYLVYLRNSHLALQVKQKEGQQNHKPCLGTLKCNTKFCYKIKSNRCWISL